MSGRAYVLAAALAALVAIPTAGASSRAGAASYTDSTGENPAAPDMTTVAVSNDDAGMLTFRVNVPNRPQLADDMGVIVFVDTDRNTATGATDYAGAELAFDLSSRSVDLARWNGSNFDFSGGSPPSLVYSYNGGATISVRASDLGLKAFNFYVFVYEGSGDVVAGDFAPDVGHGTWAYEVKLAAKKKAAKKKKKRKGR